MKQPSRNPGDVDQLRLRHGPGEDRVPAILGDLAFLREREIIVVRSGAYTADSAIIPEEYAGSVTGYNMVVNVNKAVPEFIAAALYEWRS